MRFVCFCVFAGTYIPRKEVAVLETVKATVIRENQAIRLRARKEGMDRGGVHRVTGTPKLSLCVCVCPKTPSPHPSASFMLFLSLSFVGLLPAGEEWQVSKVGAYLPGVYEEVVDIVDAFILTDKVPFFRRSSPSRCASVRELR